jgi:hypothetical protein
MDDILIATPNDLPWHRQIVREVLEIMRKESFFLKAAKYEFERQHIEYLSLILDENTIKPDPVKVNRLKEWPRKLKTVTEVCSTLGLLNYHRAFGFLSHSQTPHTTIEEKYQIRMDGSVYQSIR